MIQKFFIENKGKHIISTDYFDTVAAKKGCYYLSFLSNAARLLVPRSVLAISDITDQVSEVIITYGFWKEAHVFGFEMLFEDMTANPFAMYIQNNMSNKDGKTIPNIEHLPFYIYSEDGIYKEFSGRFRKKDIIPCLLPWIENIV